MGEKPMFDPKLPHIWVDYADNSYLIARLLWFTDFFMEAPVSSHRTIELYLKAFLASSGVPISPRRASWGHGLEGLNKECAGINQDFLNTSFVRRVKYFQRYFDLVRYPSDLKGQLKNGGLIWFSFDSCITPLDEMVAFIRPRVDLSEMEWKDTELYKINGSNDDGNGFKRKALRDNNEFLKEIICEKTQLSNIEFDEKFNCDFPGC